jgi:hypothetical protein
VNVDEALDALLGARRTGNLRDDLFTGLAEAISRRDMNSLNLVHGGLVIEAIRSELGMSYREIEDAFELPKSTAHMWARALTRDRPPLIEPPPV